MPVRAVLFDMDGVLLHSYEAWRGLVKAAGRDLAAREISDAEFHETWGQGVAADVARFFPQRTEAEVAGYYLERFGEHAAGVRADPEAAAVLAELRRRGVKTAVVTNTPGALARKVLAAAGLDPGPVVGGDDVPRAKPAPDMVAAACGRLGVRPPEALVVGDSRFDREAASAAGAAFISVGDGDGGGEVRLARLGALPRLVPAPPRSVRQRAAAAALLAAGCLAAGYGLHGVRDRPGERADYEIRGGGSRFTNPLLDCELGSYRPGRELRPFRREIETLVDEITAAGSADRISVYFRDLDNGPWFGIREEEQYTPASLLKVPTIIAALRKAEENSAFLARTVVFNGYPGERIPDQWVPDVPLVRGERYTVDELIRRTAAYSDNAAVSLLSAQVESSYKRRVFEDLDLGPFPEDTGGRAAMSPIRYGRLFRVLYNASYLSRSMSERALGYFASHNLPGGLAGGVRPGITIADKFGIHALPGRPAQLHDCGVVYLPGRPYFLCVMTEGKSADELADVIQQVSGAVFQAVEAAVAADEGGFPPR